MSAWGCLSIFFHNCLYLKKNTFQIIQYLIVPEPYYLETLTIQPGSPDFILACDPVFIVLTAINLNNDLLVKAHKINDIFPDGLLPAKLYSS